MANRFRTALLALALGTGLSRAGAQTPTPKSIRPPAFLPDTVVVNSFALYNGVATVVMGTRVTLNHTTLGQVAPTQFRVSIYPDFHDVGWLTWTSLAPTWTNPTYVNGCQTPTLTAVKKLDAYFQVRGKKSNGSLVMSNVARDTACVLLPG